MTPWGGPLICLDWHYFLNINGREGRSGWAFLRLGLFLRRQRRIETLRRSTGRTQAEGVQTQKKTNWEKKGKDIQTRQKATYSHPHPDTNK